MKSLNLLISIGCALLLLFGCAEKKRDNRAVLTVKSIPDKAVITLRGQQSATPCVCRLPQGNYLLKIEKKNHEPVWKMVSLKPNEKKELKVQLTPWKTSVLFQTKPKGARVTVNGKFAGQTPFVMKDLAPGFLEVKYKLDGYTEKSERIVLDSVRPRKVFRELENNLGRLRLESDPEGAVFSIKGGTSGTTPKEIELEQGKYLVTIRKSGYAVYSQTVLIGKGGLSSVNAVLAPLPGAISLKTEPVSASVKINGKDYGRTPIKVTQLQAGPYEVELSASGFDPVKLSLNLAPGKTAERSITLSSATGGIDLVTYPPGIKIYLDGKEQGTTIADEANPSFSKVFSIRDLMPGSHTLVMAHKRANPDRVSMKVEVSKGKIERLNNLNMWIANATLRLKDGSVYTGRLIAKLKNGEIRFDLQPGINMSFKKDEIESITPIKTEE